MSLIAIWQNKYNIIISIALSLVTISCAFHLRGYNNSDYSLPYKSVYLQCDNVIICDNLSNQIKINNLAKLESNALDADATIHVFNEQTSREPQGFNGAGRISQYNLTYQVSAVVLVKNNQVGNEINITSTANMMYNDATILADNQEETTFWNNLHNDAARRLLERVIYITKANKNTNK